jgi:PBP1b-binding outer membrane lipoprotein LpoB
MKLALRSIALVLATSLLVFGCAKKADPNKPIDQIQKEVQNMSVSDLQSNALAYVDAIKAKKGEVTKVSDQLKALSPKELFSDKAKTIRDQAASVTKEVNALTQRYEIYAKKFAEKGGDMAKIKLS